MAISQQGANPATGLAATTLFIVIAGTDSMENTPGNTLRLSHSVLVVEDDPTVQLAYQKVVFKDLACTINLVGTGQAALAAVVKDAYDLIVLDYGLPDMTGAEVCRRITKQDRSLGHERRPIIPIIMVSASGDAVKKECQQAGANQFFEKSTIMSGHFRKTVIAYLAAKMEEMM